MFSSGGVRRWRWQRDEMAAKQPTAARIQSTAGYFQWASGTFYSHVCGDRPRFYLLFFGGVFHSFIWQDILETDDRKWDKREGMTCSLDALPTEVQVNPKHRYSSAKWGLSLTLTKCFLCLTRSEPLVFQHESEKKLSCRNVFQIWTIQMFIRSLQKRTTPTASLAIGFV